MTETPRVVSGVPLVHAEASRVVSLKAFGLAEAPRVVSGVPLVHAEAPRVVF